METENLREIERNVGILEKEINKIKREKRFMKYFIIVLFVLLSFVVVYLIVQCFFPCILIWKDQS